MIGGDGAVGRARLDPLAAHIGERADLPRGRRVVVERPCRAVAGGVRELVAVVRGMDAQAAFLDDHRLVVAGLAGKDRESVVRRVVDRG